MNNAPIWGTIEKKAINEFRKDLLQMLSIGKWIDKYYARLSGDLGAYTKKFNSLIEDFNKKYKNLKLKLVKRVDNIGLKLFLNENDVKSCFENAASKIVGVQSIGISNFGAATVSNAEEFTNELEKAKNKLYITYYSPQTGTTNIFLQYDKKEKKVQLVYDLEEIENEPNPEFQLAAYYALSRGYNKKINLHDEGATLGFLSLLDAAERGKYFRKFDPHFTE